MRADSLRQNLKAVEEAIAKYGKPDVFSTDQSSQIHQLRVHRLPLEHGTCSSIDGRGE